MVVFIVDQGFIQGRQSQPKMFSIFIFQRFCLKILNGCLLWIHGLYKLINLKKPK